MAKITLNIPDALSGIRFTKEQRRRFELSLLPEMAETHALNICEKHFGKKFKLGPYNSKTSGSTHSISFKVVSGNTSCQVGIIYFFPL